MASGGSVKNDFVIPTDAVRANNHFAKGVFQVFAENEGSFSFSPLSLSGAISMLWYGATGETKYQISNAFGFDKATDVEKDINTAFEAFMTLCLKQHEFFILINSKALLIDKKYQVRDDYRNFVLEALHGLLLQLGFEEESEYFADQINDWMQLKMQNSIKYVVQYIDPNSEFVLFDSVYFQGSFLIPFNIQFNVKKVFYNKGLRKIRRKVDMMVIKDSVDFVEKETFKAVQLRLMDKKTAMLVLLPRTLDGFKDLQKLLSERCLTAFIQELQREFRNIYVEVNLPQINMAYTINFRSFMESLGIRRIFENAQMPNLTDSESLSLDEVFHTAVFFFNNDCDDISQISDPTDKDTSCEAFIADHPFLFFVYDITSSFIIFTGKVEEVDTQSSQNFDKTP